MDHDRYGIDVSHHKGAIDWEKVSHCGATYSYTKATQGGGFLDSRFRANMEGPRRFGIPTGCYHFLSANVGVQAQIDNYLQTYEPLAEAEDLPPSLDLEWDYSNNIDRWVSKSSAFITEKTKVWCEAIEQRLGRKPIIYTNLNWWNARLGANGDVLNSYGIWMSRYGKFSQSAPPMMNGFDWVMWQFTEHSKVPGINGRVDANTATPNFLAGISEPSTPATVCEIPDSPTASDALSMEELAAVFAALRVAFGPLDQARVDFLNVLVNTADTRVLRRLIAGNVSGALGEQETKEFFTHARNALTDGSLSAGQVDILDILLNTADPDAVRACILDAH